MEPTAPELSRIVEYRRDRWNMARVPLALLFCLAGLFFVVYVDPRPPGLAILKGFILLVVAAAIVALAVFAFERKFAGRVAAAGFLAAVLAILALATLCWIAPDNFFPPRRPSKLPPNLLGWSLITGGLVYFTWVLYRHFTPARPMLLLSPAGIAFHADWLKDLLIPWSEVRGVDAYEMTPASGVPNRFQDITAVLISTEFYQAQILPRRGFLMSPAGSVLIWLLQSAQSHTFAGWDQVFSPRGASVQLVLHYTLFSIPPEQIRQPIETRWQAFRNERPTSSLPGARPIPQAREIYGAWSIRVSLWQAVQFLVPLIGIIAILAHSTRG
jgi:hypothetical protein